MKDRSGRGVLFADPEVEGSSDHDAERPLTSWRCITDPVAPPVMRQNRVGADRR